MDGLSTTAWHTLKATGNNKLTTEWIVIDLESEVVVTQVILEWAENYAIEYEIQISLDNINWVSVSSEFLGDGGTDYVEFSAVTTRYVRMETFSWNNGARRNWLNEVKVYSVAISQPTSTPTPTPGPTASPTPSPTPGPTITPTQIPADTIHSGDLDGFSTSLGSTWTATVTLSVHDENHTPIANALVEGDWIVGFIGTFSCVTDINGECSVTSGEIVKKVGSATLSVTSINFPTLAYYPSANHDPDGGSDGTTINILK